MFPATVVQNICLGQTRYVLCNRIGRFAKAEGALDIGFRCLTTESNVTRQDGDCQCRVAGGDVER